MTVVLNKCAHYAKQLHEDVVYGGGLNMMDQINGTVALVAKYSRLTGADKETALAAAFLHKCFEPKRIKEGVEPLTMDQVEKIAGPQVRAVVEELSTEPETETLSKVDQWKEKAEWAQKLSPAAQEILLAEKVLNFEVSRDRPNPKKPLTWHKEYFETRMLMVDKIKDTNPELYRVATQTRDQALVKINALLLKQSGHDGR